MKNQYLTIVLAVIVSFSASANEISLTGKGSYQLGEFDTEIAAKKIAEMKAIEDIASKTKQKVISLQAIDKNGFYSRASWIIKSAMLQDKQTEYTISECISGNGRCVTATITATVDTNKSEANLIKIYSDIKLIRKLENIITSEADWEKDLLAGLPIDIAFERSLLAKRKQVLDYLSSRFEKKQLGKLEQNNVKTLLASNDKYRRQSLNIEQQKQQFHILLNRIKTDLRLALIEKKEVLHSDIDGGIRVKVSISSNELKGVVNWVAEQLGVPGGTWESYFKPYYSKDNNTWVYKVRRNSEYGNAFDESVIVGESKNLTVSPDKYNIQYGMNTQGMRQFKSNRHDNRLDYNKIRFVNSLRNARVCIEFSLGNESPVSKCIVGGEKNLRSGLINSAWDINAPYLWFAKSGSEFNVFLPYSEAMLSKPETLYNLPINYSVKVKFDY